MNKTASSVSRMAAAIRSRQGILGTAIFSLFLVASVMVNQTVQALNLAAGNYGYYGGTYGYNTNDTSSDAPPAEPGTISATASNASADLSWSAPTLTTLGTAISTGSGSIASYNVYYNTSSISTCAAGTGGSSTSSTSTTKTISNLTSGTTYYVVVCAVDNNQNEGSPRPGSFVTTSASGGAGGGGGSGASIFSSPATTTTTTPSGTIVSRTVTAISVVGDAAQLVSALGLTRDTAAEASALVKVNTSLAELKVSGVTAEQKTALSNFVAYGISSATIALGSGERLALVRDQLETLGKVSMNALEQLATGKKPTERNLTKEKQQVAACLAAFSKKMGRKPNFKATNEDLGWNTCQYRIRFTRDLVKERTGISEFRKFMKRLPKSPSDWAIVRMYGYQLSK
ncbi:fibronectin type III domain-containing protein [Candidatus Uhrbacteria bacterium]|nr:fibronectin type III domain-containing protein [Candidatus Uhrbacteria bacterium]